MTLDTLATFILRAYVVSAVPLAIAWLLSWMLVRRRASVRHHVWAIAVAIAVLALAAPLVRPRVHVPVLSASSVARAMPVPATRSAPVPSVPEATQRQSLVRPFQWPTRFPIALWLTGAAALFALRLHRRLRLRALRGRTRPWSGSARIGIHEDVIVPMVAGLRRPIVLLPAAAADWPRDELDAILAHERAHIARRDDVIAAISEIATMVYWLNPLAWIAAAALERERETACDDEVLRAGVKPSVYAAALVRVAETLRPSPRVAGAVAMAGTGVYARVRDVLEKTERPSGRAPLSWVTTGVVVLAMAIGSASISLVAQSPVGLDQALGRWRSTEQFEGESRITVAFQRRGSGLEGWAVLLGQHRKGDNRATLAMSFATANWDGARFTFSTLLPEDEGTIGWELRVPSPGKAVLRALTEDGKPLDDDLEWEMVRG